MAAISGTAGSVVYVSGGTPVIDELTEWSLSIANDTVETTAWGDTWKEFLPLIPGATGSFSGNHSHGSVQLGLGTALATGTLVGLKLYLNATQGYSGSAYLTGQNPATSITGKADTSYDFTMSGAVTAF